MPNYLNTARTAYQVGRNFDVTGQQIQTAGINAGWAAVSALTSGENVFDAALNSALPAIPGSTTLVNAASAVSSLLGGPSFGGITGTKPKALHTEYAAGSASWAKPYGSGTDIVFYLQRADGGGASASEAPAAAGTGVLPSPAGGSSPSLTGEPTSNVGGGVQPARVRADVQAGPGLPHSLQSPLNQIATSASIRGAVSSVDSVTPGLMGPLTGVTQGLYVEPGGSSQALAPLTSTQRAVFEVTQAAIQFAKRPTRSLPGSEGFFTRTLFKSFNPETSFDSLGSTTSIEQALERPPVAEFSASMAVFSGGIASTSDLIESINYGRVGFSTSGSAAEASRIGPQGLTERFTK